MEMHLGEHNDEHMFIYERSRFRAAVVGAVITSVLTAALGIFAWPVLRDMSGSQINTLQVTALTLGGALAVMALVWLYFSIRLLFKFFTYMHEARRLHHVTIFAWVNLVFAFIFILSVPVIIFILDPIK